MRPGSDAFRCPGSVNMRLTASRISSGVAESGRAFPSDLPIFALPSMPGRRPTCGMSARASDSTSTPACRDERCLETGDVGRLRDRIAEKARRNIPAEAARLDLILDRRVALEPRHRDEVHV